MAGVTIKLAWLTNSTASSSQEKPSLSDKIFDKLMDHSVAAMEEVLGEIGTLRVFDLFAYFDDKYIRPLVIRNYKKQEPQLMQVTYLCYICRCM